LGLGIHPFTSPLPSLKKEKTYFNNEKEEKKQLEKKLIIRIKKFTSHNTVYLATLVLNN